jgi:hypothetical protein
VKDGEKLKFTYTFTKDGFERSAESEVTIEGLLGAGVKYCEMDSSSVNHNIHGNCYFQDSEGTQVFPETMEVECDGIPGGCVGSWGEIASSNVMNPSDVGIHTMRVRGQIDSVWTEWYEFSLMVDYAESKIIIQTDANTYTFNGTQDYVARIAEVCFAEYAQSCVDDVQDIGDSCIYERNTTSSTQTEVDDARACVEAEAVATLTEEPLLGNYAFAEGKLPKERMDEIPTTEANVLVQAFFGN